MEERTTVAISGGGPAGIMLGLLLARQGVEVLVLEKHSDFLRDFRGDTVHPMTQAVLDDLRLIDEFDRIVRGRMPSMGGIGINLAIGDAVAAANLLGPALLRAQDDPDRFRRRINPALLSRVQRRRLPAAVLTQRIQVLMQNRVLAMTEAADSASLTPPALMLALLRGPVARIMPRVFVYGVRPERVARIPVD